MHYYGRSLYNGLSQSGICNVTIFHKNQGKTYRIPISEGTKPVASIEVGNTVRSGSEEALTVVRVHTDRIPKLTIPREEKE